MTDPAPETHRLFFALWPDDGLRAALASAVDAVGVGGRGRRVAVAKYHVTLHFLGGWPEFPAGIVEAARDAATRVRASAFELVVDHAGGFTRSRVGWLAPAANAGLDALWSSLGAALDAAEIPRRAAESFSPHVTVLRNVRGSIDPVPIQPLSWPVEDFVLVHSHGGRYDVLDRWKLAPA